MRVAHLTPFFPDGGARLARDYARALNRVAGFETRVIAFGPDDAEFRSGGVDIRVLRDEAPAGAATGPFSPRVRAELGGFDLVHVHDALGRFGAYWLATLRGSGAALAGTHRGEAPPVEWMIRGRGVELFDGLVSVSDYARDVMAPGFRGLEAVLP